MPKNRELKDNTRQNWLTAAFVFILGISILFNIYREAINAKTGMQSGWIQTVLDVGLLLAWAYSIRMRVMQPKVKRFLIETIHLLVLLILLRAIKYYGVEPGTTQARILWYLYYIPMLLFPVCALLATIFIGKADSARVEKKHIYLFGISSILLMFVLTNDLHQLVFRFPDGALIHSDINYSYGAAFYAIYAWFLSCVTAMLAIMFIKCRLPGRKNRIVLPLIPLVIGFIYDIAYITGHYNKPYLDIILVFSIVTISTFELAIRTGLIRSNTHYVELLEHSNLSTRILDKDLNVIYSSNTMDFDETPSINILIEHGSLIVDNQQFSASPITGGYVVWQDDIKELLATRSEIEATNEYLEGENSAISNQYNTAIKLKRLEEKNRLFTAIQKLSSDKFDELTRLITRFKESETQEEESDTLLAITIIMVYLKRKNNLLLLAEENQELPSTELSNCLNDMAKNLGAFGIECSIDIRAKKTLSLAQLLHYLDRVYEVVSETAANRPIYHISLDGELGEEVLTITTSGGLEVRV